MFLLDHQWNIPVTLIFDRIISKSAIYKSINLYNRVQIRDKNQYQFR